MRFSPVNPVARGAHSGSHTEKSLLGSELKFSVMGGKKKRGNSGKVCNSVLAELCEKIQRN